MDPLTRSIPARYGYALAAMLKGFTATLRDRDARTPDLRALTNP
jgi:hypothetical protein